MERIPKGKKIKSYKTDKSLCLTITSLAQGGAEKQCLLLAQILKKNYQVMVVIIDTEPLYLPFQHFLDENKIDHFKLKGNAWSKLLLFRRILKQRNVNLILSYLPKDIYYSMLAGSGIVPTHIGGIRNANMSFWKRKALQWIHNYYLDATIANCHSGQAYFKLKGFDASKLTVIHNGISARVPPIERTKKDMIHICTLGRLVGQKDFATAIRSLHYLISLFEVPPPVSLSIIGSGPDEYALRNLSKELNLSNKITLITDCTDVSDILKESDIYLCTSLFEGVSNAIMEAMTYSLPVVATDVGDNSFLVREGKNGFIHAVGDHIGMGNALRELMLSHALRIKFGRESYRLITENFSLEHMGEQYRNYLERWL